MTPEIKAAAERYLNGDYPQDGGTKSIEACYADGDKVCRAYLADMAAREAMERERALPIDRDRLVSIAPVNGRDSVKWRVSDTLTLWVDRSDFSVTLEECDQGINLPRLKNMGQLLDLLSALGVQQKGGE